MGWTTSQCFPKEEKPGSDLKINYLEISDYVSHLHIFTPCGTDGPHRNQSGQHQSLSMGKVGHYNIYHSDGNPPLVSVVYFPPVTDPCVCAFHNWNK